MNMTVNPDLAAALARIAELEDELAEGDRIDRFNNKYTDSIEEALEEVEEELVAERAKAIDADQMRLDAEREIQDLVKENEGLVEELKEANKQADEEAGKVTEALAVVADLLRDYLVSNFSMTGSRLPPELRKLCDEVSLSW
ncbi:hypothetical protein [Bosea sp. MMO-172]|uniref:hypothetical protein n=1 Tax=Bosea sp. MMO-172 TaxID=3127885 RepID=UPI00301897BD